MLKLKEWLSLATSLEDDEKDLKKTRHSQVRSIVEPTRILLWEAMMRSAGYDDVSVAGVRRCSPSMFDFTFVRVCFSFSRRMDRGGGT